MRKNKKTKPTTSKEIQVVKEEKIENKTPVKKEKSILKPFALFALIVGSVGYAALYAYLTEPFVLPMPATAEPPLYIDEADLIAIEKAKEEAQKTKAKVQNDCSAEKNLIASGEKMIENLNARIRQLEADNLILTKRISDVVANRKITVLTVQLMKEIYTGQAFKASLNELLAEDKDNPFAQIVQTKLGAYSNTGLPTVESLKKEFQKQLKMAKDSLYTDKTDASWNQKLSAFFKSLIHVYPENINPNNATDAQLLFLIRTQVDAGLFEKALINIEKLPQASKQFFAAFSKNANRYLEAKQIIDGYLN